jgi:hypothetical protein
VRGETRLLVRKYLTKCGCISSSTTFLLCVAYNDIRQAITTIRCVSYVARRPVKYATNAIRSKYQVEPCQSKVSPSYLLKIFFSIEKEHGNDMLEILKNIDNRV